MRHGQGGALRSVTIFTRPEVDAGSPRTGTADDADDAGYLLRHLVHTSRPAGWATHTHTHTTP